MTTRSAEEEEDTNPTTLDSRGRQKINDNFEGVCVFASLHLGHTLITPLVTGLVV